MAGVSLGAVQAAFALGRVPGCALRAYAGNWATTVVVCGIASAVQGIWPDEARRAGQTVAAGTVLIVSTGRH